MFLTRVDWIHPYLTGVPFFYSSETALLNSLVPVVFRDQGSENKNRGFWNFPRSYEMAAEAPVLYLCPHEKAEEDTAGLFSSLCGVCAERVHACEPLLCLVTSA